MKMEAEVGVEGLQAREHQGDQSHQRQGAAGRVLPVGIWGDQALAHTVTPGVWPSENAFLWHPVCGPL